MQQKSFEKYERVRAMVDSGVRLKDALADEKMASNTYYAAQKLAAKEARKSTKVKTKVKKSHNFFDIPGPVALGDDGQIAVVVCSVGNLKKVLGGLK